jgi:hypothetical protein
MNTSVFSSILELDSQLVWRWYRDHLSDFRESEATGDHYRHDLPLDNGETVRVPIYEPDNFGKSMSIDEKPIGEEMHTILSNRETGKIALMVRSMKYEDIQKLLDKESLICHRVETLTRDLSPLYAKVGNELFFNSSAIADKFHIIRFGATNAIAENINSQIQRFIMINQGTRDREFFYFRMKKYFA